MGTTIDYDLNIFQREYEVDGAQFEYREPWYLHIYEVDGAGHKELGNPIELTEAEANNLIKVDPYFDNEVDTWYGLEGFIQEKQTLLSDRLRSLFSRLPVYKEEVLF